MSEDRKALILGATGGAGYETAKALLAHGWAVRAMGRDTAKGAALLPQAEWVAGDATNAGDVAAAATGCAVIFHGVNPPGYRDWERLALPMLQNTIAAAERHGARIALPGSVYNYGPDAFPLLAETSPQRPPTRKGRIKVEMERRLEAAARTRGVRALVLRAGDFFGPHTGNSWFSDGLIRRGRPLTSVTYPGKHDVGHAWAYLPDFGEAFARLIERDDELAAFDTFHFAGHWFDRGIEMAERLKAAAGRPGAPVRGLPWPLVVALSPAVRLFREIAEMRYLWKVPVRLDNRKLTALLGAEPHTDIDGALRRSLEGQGCVAI